MHEQKHDDIVTTSFSSGAVANRTKNDRFWILFAASKVKIFWTSG